MIIKNIQCNSGNHCIAHCILLVQKSGICTRLYFIPSTPFINYKRNFFFRIIFIHYVPNGLITSSSICQARFMVLK